MKVRTKERLRDFFGGFVSPDAPAKNEPGPYVPAGQEWDDLFNTITDMITVHDKDFNIIYANKSADTMLGLPPLNVSKAKCFEYYHGGECPPEGCPGRTCLRTGKSASVEMFEPHLKMYIEIQAIPRFDRHGGILGVIHIVRDITKRKLIEEELDIHRNHLEWLVRERTTEISAVNERLQREIAERKRAEMEKEWLIRELEDAFSNLKTLSGLLPICAWCKKIRDDGGYWKQVEAYIAEHSNAEFTHGICPDCAEKLKEDLHLPKG
ncbi:MAG: PAS domain-containing protein [Nitrospiraceae bacterium]|nr:PAS domain-containing protein [Nitrospiraceae bacterium]